VREYKETVAYFNVLKKCITFNKVIFYKRLVPTVARSKARVVWDRLNTGITDSNPATGMDIRPHFLVFRCPVQASRWAYSSSKQSYQSV